MWAGNKLLRIMLQFGELKREEIREAAELAARAYQDYIYITIFFTEPKERLRGMSPFLACNKKANFGRANSQLTQQIRTAAVMRGAAVIDNQ